MLLVTWQQQSFLMGSMEVQEPLDVTSWILCTTDTSMTAIILDGVTMLLKKLDSWLTLWTWESQCNLPTFQKKPKTQMLINKYRTDTKNLLMLLISVPKSMTKCASITFKKTCKQTPITLSLQPQEQKTQTWQNWCLMCSIVSILTNTGLLPCGNQMIKIKIPLKVLPLKEPTGRTAIITSTAGTSFPLQWTLLLTNLG